jgi:hypothetical protein
VKCVRNEKNRAKIVFGTKNKEFETGIDLN